MKVAGSSLICFHYSQMAQKRNEQKGTQKKKCSKKSWRMTSSKIMSPWTAMARQKEGRKVTTTTVRRGSRCRNYSATTVPLSDHLIRLPSSTAFLCRTVYATRKQLASYLSDGALWLLMQLFLPLPDLTTAE
jgi:hypothetical protein